MRKTALLPVLVLFFAIHGCGDKGPVKRSWGRMEDNLKDVVGNMNDTSYSTGRTQKPRISASGKPVHMTDFEGQFVWSEYAATWCPTCARQTPETKKVEKEMKGELVFLTVMTGKSKNYNDHATKATAQEWANRFKLDKDRVVAAELWFKTVPEHRLYSPEGHTLFVHVGFLPAEKIKEVINYYKTGWERWSATGEEADWMTFR